MASKAAHRKTTIDVIKQQKKNAKRLAGQGRQAASGISAAASSTTSLAPSSQGSSAGANIAGHLKTGGDTMIGPLGFWRGAYTTIYPSSSNNNTLDISASTGAHTSHVIWYSGGSNTLEIISGAAFNGQILFLESTQTLTQTIKDKSNTTGGNTGNIKTLDGNDLALGTDKTIVLLIYSDIDTSWHQVSNPEGGGSALLSSTNTWTGVNTFQANVSFTGATTTIGDANTDLCTIYAKMGTDVNMGTYDINTLDRLLFDVNGSDAIGSSDYGIGAEASGGSTVGLIYSTPASKTHKFNIGGTPELTISNSYISAATKRITNVTDPTGAQDAATKAYVDANGGGSWVGTATTQLNMGAHSIKGAWGGTANTLGVESDLDMNTYDINTIDRLLFNTGGSDAIGSSDYGIGAEALGGSAVGMIFSVPSNKTHKFSIGSTPELTISNSYISAASKRITNVTDPSGAQDAATKAYVDANSGGGSGANTTLSNLGTTALNAALNMNGQNIQGNGTLTIKAQSSGGGEINYNASTHDFEAGTLDDVLNLNMTTSGGYLKRNGTNKMRLTSSGVEMHGDLTLGGSEVINFTSLSVPKWNGLNHATGTPSGDPQGYVNIRVGSSWKKLYYYS